MSYIRLSKDAKKTPNLVVPVNSVITRRDFSIYGGITNPAYDAPLIAAIMLEQFREEDYLDYLLKVVTGRLLGSTKGNLSTGSFKEMIEQGLIDDKPQSIHELGTLEGRIFRVDNLSHPLGNTSIKIESWNKDKAETLYRTKEPLLMTCQQNLLPIFP